MINIEATIPRSKSTMAEQNSTQVAIEVCTNVHLMILTIAGLGISRLNTQRWVQQQPAALALQSRDIVDYLTLSRNTSTRVQPFDATSLVWLSIIDTVVVYCTFLLTIGVLPTFAAWETTLKIAAQCAGILATFASRQAIMSFGWRARVRRGQRGRTAADFEQQQQQEQQGADLAKQASGITEEELMIKILELCKRAEAVLGV
ncbi:hypothetical protein LTR95_015482 [Oleoguttula sp. CCFEE 5521]